MTEKNVKNTNTWRLNNTLPNNQGITEETKEELIKYLDTNDKKKKNQQNLQDMAKTVLRWKFIAIQSFLNKQDKSQINTWTLHLGFPGDNSGKNHPVNAGDVRGAGLIHWSRRSPGGGHNNSLQYFCLENPMDRGSWWAMVHRVAKRQTWLKWLSMHTHNLTLKATRERRTKQCQS